jgi:hypothetical protein
MIEEWISAKLVKALFWGCLWGISRGNEHEYGVGGKIAAGTAVIEQAGHPGGTKFDSMKMCDHNISFVYSTNKNIETLNKWKCPFCTCASEKVKISQDLGFWRKCYEGWLITFFWMIKRPHGLSRISAHHSDKSKCIQLPILLILVHFTFDLFP